MHTQSQDVASLSSTEHESGGGGNGRRETEKSGEDGKYDDDDAETQGHDVQDDLPGLSDKRDKHSATASNTSTVSSEGLQKNQSTPKDHHRMARPNSTKVKKTLSASSKAGTKSTPKVLKQISVQSGSTSLDSMAIPSVTLWRKTQMSFGSYVEQYRSAWEDLPIQDSVVERVGRLASRYEEVWLSSAEDKQVKTGVAPLNRKRPAKQEASPDLESTRESQPTKKRCKTSGIRNKETTFQIYTDHSVSPCPALNIGHHTLPPADIDLPDSPNRRYGPYDIQPRSSVHQHDVIAAHYQRAIDSRQADENARPIEETQSQSYEGSCSEPDFEREDYNARGGDNSQQRRRQEEQDLQGLNRAAHASQRAAFRDH